MSLRSGFMPSCLMAFAVAALFAMPALADNSDNQNPAPMPLNGAIMPPQKTTPPPNLNDIIVKNPIVVKPSPPPVQTAPVNSGNGNNGNGGNTNNTNNNYDDNHRHHTDTVFVPYIVPVPVGDYSCVNGVCSAAATLITNNPPAPTTCAAQNVTVCGTSVGIAAGTAIGETVMVDIPNPALSDDWSESQSFAAQCVSNGVDAPIYQVVDAGNLSCNAFPCQDAKMRLCNISVNIPGGTAMGEVLQMAMPKPFVPDIFTVQCLGTNDKPPAYQMMDNSAVTCKRSTR